MFLKKMICKIFGHKTRGHPLWSECSRCGELSDIAKLREDVFKATGIPRHYFKSEEQETKEVDHENA